MSEIAGTHHTNHTPTATRDPANTALATARAIVVAADMFHFHHSESTVNCLLDW